MMAACCVLLSPIFNLVRLRAGSVLAPSLLHGSLNGTSGLAILLLEGGDDLTVGVTGLSGFLVLGAVNLGIYLLGRGKLWSS